MATDSLSVRCTCGEEFMIAKTMDYCTWYPPSSGHMRQWETWLEKHSQCRLDRDLDIDKWLTIERECGDGT